jgi:hypothetical protein
MSLRLGMMPSRTTVLLCRCSYHRDPLTLRKRSPRASSQLTKVLNPSSTVNLFRLGEPNDSPLPGSLARLQEAVAELKGNYEQFVKYNQDFVLPADNFQTAFEDAERETDFRCAARTFKDGIRSVLTVIENKHKSKESKWTSIIGNFIVKLYPIAKLSLGFASAIGEVRSFVVTY